MIVLSLFDGISVGQLALKSLGHDFTYYASEIDKNAIKVTLDNFPSTIHIGDVRKVSYSNGILYTEKGEYNIPKIDLILAGSPCTNLSSSGNRKGLEGNESNLFYEFARILKEVNPTYFLLENVVMAKKWEDEISNLLCTKPILIDSALVSAQTRKRLYWTNIKFEIPTDRGILFSSIINGCPAAMRGRRLASGGRKDNDKSIPIKQYIESKKFSKSNCLTTVNKDNVVVDYYAPRRLATETVYRYLTQIELEQLQTLPIGYTKSISYHLAVKAIGNSWTVDVIKEILKGLDTLNNNN